MAAMLVLLIKVRRVTRKGGLEFHGEHAEFEENWFVVYIILICD
jgi:hypothetical protein